MIIAATPAKALSVSPSHSMGREYDGSRVKITLFKASAEGRNRAKRRGQHFGQDGITMGAALADNRTDCLCNRR
jgi:hypothetical protein